MKDLESCKKVMEQRVAMFSMLEAIADKTMAGLQFQVNQWSMPASELIRDLLIASCPIMDLSTPDPSSPEYTKLLKKKIESSNGNKYLLIDLEDNVSEAIDKLLDEAEEIQADLNKYGTPPVLAFRSSAKFYKKYPKTKLRLKLLKQKIGALEALKKNVSEAALKFEDEIKEMELDLKIPERLSVLPYAIPSFVELLEKANDYFDLKENAIQSKTFKSTMSSYYIYYKLWRQQQKSEVSTLSKHALDNVSKAILGEVRAASRPDKKREDPALRDHIHSLVYKARNSHYDMDLDPRVELVKMMNIYRDSYDGYFLNQYPRLEKCTISSEESVKAVEKYSKLVGIMRAKASNASVMKGAVDKHPNGGVVREKRKRGA